MGKVVKGGSKKKSVIMNVAPLGSSRMKMKGRKTCSKKV